MVHRLVEEDVKRGHKRGDIGCQFDLERAMCSRQSSNRVDSNNLLVNQTLDSAPQGNALVCCVANGMMKSIISGEVIPPRDWIGKRTRSWLPQ